VLTRFVALFISKLNLCCDHESFLFFAVCEGPSCWRQAQQVCWELLASFRASNVGGASGLGVRNHFAELAIALLQRLDAPP
jgi:hypothetical protein